MSLAAAGDGGADIPSRYEVEQLLDNPSLQGEHQRGFALRYLDYVEEDPTAYGFRDEADFNAFKEKYKERLSISEGDLSRSWDDAESDVQEFYTKAKEDYDRLRADARQGDRDAVNGGAGALETIRGRSSETSAGAANSNEILDAGSAGLRAFDVWLPLYNRALRTTGGGAAVPIEEIHRLYDEQRDIPFDKFDAGAVEFTTLHDAITESAAEVETQLRNTLSTWEGAAADRAREHQRGFADKTAVVAESIGTSAEGLRHTLGSVGKFCQEKANWVLTYYFDSVGAVTAQDMERLVRVAEGNGSQNDIIHCIGFLGIDAQNRFNDDWGDLDQDTVDFIVEQARVWLRDVFCTWFREHIDNYRTMCENIRSAVDGAWNAFTDMLAGLPENPYSDVAAPTPPQNATAPAAPAGDPATGPGVGSGGVPVAPGPDATAPGVTAPAATAPTPDVPTPAVPGATEPASSVPAPATDTATESPTATADPSGKDQEDEPNLLRISHGDYEISLNVPDGDGTIEITVDDGSGTAQSYVLDFTGPDQPQEQDADPVRQDTAAPAGVPLAEQPHRPGEDGKIHVAEGDLRVVAEQPDGPGGDTVMTVDDGTGEPTTYRFGSEQLTSPQSVSALGGVAAGAALGDISQGAAAGTPDPGVPVSGADVAGAPRQASSGAGLGTAPGGTSPIGDEVAATAPGMMGGAGGAGGGSAGDQERSAGAYRVAGDIFDIGSSGDRISGTLGLDDDRVAGPQPSER